MRHAMKRTLCILLALALAFSLGAAAFAAGEPDSEPAGVLPSPTQIDIVLSATLTGRYVDDVTDGSGDIEGPGFEAHVRDGIPADAVRLVVVPIYDPDALAWFSGCVGEHWSDTGVIYAVFYEDRAGNRLPAPGVQMSVTVTGGYDGLNVYAVSEAGAASSLDYRSSGASVSFTTDGSLYYGVVHKQGVLDEKTDVGPGAPDTTLDTPLGELADDLLTDEDRGYLDEGIDIHIRLTVEDITGFVDPAEISAVDSVVGEYTAGEYIDVELFKQVGDQAWENIHETNRPLYITVSIPEYLQGHAEYAIIRVHDGTAMFLPDLDSDPATITFATSLFSTYAIVYHDPKPTARPASGGVPGSGGVPETGDDTPVALYAAVLFLSLSGIFVLAVGTYRRRDKTASRSNETAK